MSSWFRKLDPRRSAEPAPLISRSDTAAVRRFFRDVTKASVAQQVAIGAVGGWCSGFMFRKVGKVAALAIGGGILIIQVASHQGYLKINWSKIDRSVDAVQREIARQDPSYWTNSIETFLRNNVFLAGAYAGGFLIGLVAP
jgi:FUN14 domain-containing protein 1